MRGCTAAPLQPGVFALLHFCIIAEGQGGCMSDNGRRPGQVLAVAMQKGGVGKTTTTVNLAVTLGRVGRRVLVIDLDPQANATRGLGVDGRACEYSSYEVLLNPDHGVAFAAVRTDFGIDLVPAVLDLAQAEIGLAGTIARELRPRNALAKGRARGPCDYILIRTPPALGAVPPNPPD